MRAIIELDYLRYSANKKGSWTAYLRKAISNAGFRAVLLYRIGHWLHLRQYNFLASMSQRFMHHACHCWISVTAEIGSGFLIAHVGGIVVGGQTVIGNNCDIRQNVTFGGNFNKMNANGFTQPMVGDNVSIGAGAAILGPVTIGTNAIIGANSVVTRDVPENMIAFGVPAKVIKERWNKESSSRQL